MYQFVFFISYDRVLSERVRFRGLCFEGILFRGCFVGCFVGRFGGGGVVSRTLPCFESDCLLNRIMIHAPGTLLDSGIIDCKLHILQL